MNALLEIREKPKNRERRDALELAAGVGAIGSRGPIASTARPAPICEPPPSASTQPPSRTITLRIGLLGLGGVGKALIAVERRARRELRDRGLELRFSGALVRNARRYRGPLPNGLLLTDAADEFFLRRYDVVIDVMGGVEPAGALVREALRRGSAVVTANKTLMAEQGPALRRLARLSGVPLLYEAAVIAGVPFLTALRGRPLAARVDRITAILNGTSNYILTRIARDGVGFDEAVRDAQNRGYAEPDPASDVGGHDAAQKLAVLLQEFAAGEATPAQLEVRGIDGLTPDDLRTARRFGGAIKPVAHADVDRTTGRIAAFVGPAFVPQSHRLASVDGCDNGLLLRGSRVPELFFAGPGAGCEVTAATILDDVAELTHRVTGRRTANPVQPFFNAAAEVSAPKTGWFVRLDFNRAGQGRGGASVPANDSICQFLASHSVWPRRVESSTTGDARLYLLTSACSRERIEAALSALSEATGCDAACLRVLEEGQ